MRNMNASAAAIASMGLISPAIPAAGLPVVSTAVGGVPEVAGDAGVGGDGAIAVAELGNGLPFDLRPGLQVAERKLDERGAGVGRGRAFVHAAVRTLRDLLSAF